MRNMCGRQAGFADGKLYANELRKLLIAGPELKTWVRSDWASTPLSRLFFSSQHLTDVAVNLGGVLRRLFDQLHPFLAMRLQFRLAKQIRSLHDGLDRIAEIVRQVT